MALHDHVLRLVKEHCDSCCVEQGQIFNLVNLNRIFLTFLFPQKVQNSRVNSGDISRTFLVINAYLLGFLNNEVVLKVVRSLSKRMTCDWMLYFA